MKNNILLITLITSLILACTIFSSDGIIYAITSFMALVIIGAIQSNKSRVFKITRWAKANPKTTQWLIAGMQLVLLGVGIMTGKNLKELGYQFSNTTAYVFSVIIVIGFLLVPFISKPSTIAIPKAVNSQRLAYLGITLSCLIMVVLIGNRIGDFYPNSPVTHVINSVDQWIFSNEATPNTRYMEGMMGEADDKNDRQNFAVFAVAPLPGKASLEQSKKDLRNSKTDLRQAKKDFRKKLRQAAAAGSGAGSVLLIILLVITSCAGICLLIFGVASIGTGASIGTSILSIVLGAAILYGSIKGIIAVGKRRRETNE